ncbi:hypothetical protein L6164_008610 [Bauhinia variegata]|uniref:Uncharacterized protein n=1 Tax=Bauhinia variegata TaxID=167791 RepID=A0ACB9PHA1_BAUVA|nr:hypothetical protein L6164_008610 [Bauhinia variegata]
MAGRLRNLLLTDQPFSHCDDSFTVRPNLHDNFALLKSAKTKFLQSSSFHFQNSKPHSSFFLLAFSKKKGKEEGKHAGALPRPSPSSLSFPPPDKTLRLRRIGVEAEYNWQSTVAGNPGFRRRPKKSQIKGLQVVCWQQINFGSLKVVVGKSHDLKEKDPGIC